MNFNSIQTERFLLKILTEELVTETYLSWFRPQNEVEHIEYATKKNITIESLKSFVQEKLLNPNCLFFGIYEQKSYAHIGNIKFEPINFQDGYAVLGVLIGESQWRGKGVFSEIFEALVIELKKVKVNKIYLGVSRENGAAVLAYKKAGFIIDSENFLDVKPEKGFCMVKHL